MHWLSQLLRTTMFSMDILTDEKRNGLHQIAQDDCLEQAAQFERAGKGKILPPYTQGQNIFAIRLASGAFLKKV